MEIHLFVRLGRFVERHHRALPASRAEWVDQRAGEPTPREELRAAEGTALARAQCGTIREKMLKIGAQIRVSVRRVWLSMSESYPRVGLFREVLARLEAIPIRC